MTQHSFLIIQSKSTWHIHFGKFVITFLTSMTFQTDLKSVMHAVQQVTRFLTKQTGQVNEVRHKNDWLCHISATSAYDCMRYAQPLKEELMSNAVCMISKVGVGCPSLPLRELRLSELRTVKCLSSSGTMQGPREDGGYCTQIRT